MSPEELFTRNTDWDLLKIQKATIVALLSASTCIGHLLTEEAAEHLDGLLNFIDAIQDLAVDYYGVDEDKVFVLSNG